MKCYIDNSVFGGYYDIEFSEPTKKFFKEIDAGKKQPFISAISIMEVEGAPSNVRTLFEKHRGQSTFLPMNKEIEALAEAYIKEKALTRKSLSDALHIATASVYRLDVIVSWNFKHIVNLNRIRLFHAVNLKNGYPMIEIRTPQEVLTP
jgi:predicted nucleic acid-binding protein